MKYSVAIMALALLAACSSEIAERSAANDREATEEQQRGMVEAAIRRSYENAGAEVVDIEMERTPDGTHYVGHAKVRDPENGEELDVDCTVSADARGAPQIECNRAQGDDA